MKRFINWLIVLAGCAGAIYGVGLIVPRSQTQGSKTNLTAKPEEIYALVADVSTWPQWHPDFASVQERPERNDHPVWRVLTKEGETFELEVTSTEEAKHWQSTYTSGGSRTTLRFDLGWYGTGGRVRVTKSTDTRDPWLRAKGFFFERSEATPIAVLNALAAELGEPGQAEPN